MGKLFNAGRNDLGGMFQQIVSGGIEWFRVKPNDGGVDSASRNGLRPAADHIAAADIDLVCQGERHRQGRVRYRQIRIEGDDPFDARSATRRRRQNLVSYTYGS